MYVCFPNRGCILHEQPLLPVQEHIDTNYILREAILQKIPEFYEIILQAGGGGQPDFISLIQKC